MISCWQKTDTGCSIFAAAVVNSRLRLCKGYLICGIGRSRRRSSSPLMHVHVLHQPFCSWRYYSRQIGNHKTSRGLAAIAKDLLEIESIDKARSLKSLVFDHRAFIFRAHGTFCLNSILCITRYLPRRSREPLICCSESTPLQV